MARIRVFCTVYLTVPDALNRRLKDGEERAFNDLANGLQKALTTEDYIYSPDTVLKIDSVDAVEKQEEASGPKRKLRRARVNPHRSNTDQTDALHRTPTSD